LFCDPRPVFDELREDAREPVGREVRDERPDDRFELDARLELPRPFACPRLPEREFVAFDRPDDWPRPVDREPLERAVPEARPVPRELPADRPPEERAPVERAPVERPPVDRPPVDRPPVDRPPVDRPPDRAPEDRAPLDRAPLDRPAELRPPPPRLPPPPPPRPPPPPPRPNAVSSAISMMATSAKINKYHRDRSFPNIANLLAVVV
jgi:hypothetical protein